MTDSDGLTIACYHRLLWSNCERKREDHFH